MSTSVDSVVLPCMVLPFVARGFVAVRLLLAAHRKYVSPWQRGEELCCLVFIHFAAFTNATRHTPFATCAAGIGFMANRP